MTEEQLTELLDRYDVPPGDPDERLIRVLDYWKEQHEQEET